jgi:hypothetical protein
VEKTPIHVRYLEKLFLLRPKAQVVLVVRDGRDVIASLKARSVCEQTHKQMYSCTTCSLIVMLCKRDCEGLMLMEEMQSCI